jgi:hypothetical protein
MLRNHEGPRLEELSNAEVLARLGERTEQVRQDAARDRLHLGAVGHLPLNPADAHRELTDEQRALRSTRPRNRRWRALDKHDAEIERLQLKLHEAMARAGDAEQALQRAPEDDARALTEWMAAGERGARPASTVYERERERDAARLLVAALERELDHALERRVAHVDKHRGAMVKDARADINKARDELLAAARQLPALRETLLAARETCEWIASFPDRPASYGFASALALGLLEPVERTLQTKARLEYSAVLAALEEDATALASRFARPVAERLGTARDATPVSEAMWASDERHKAWAAQELERARRLAEYGDVNQLAREADDFRPDPA